MKGALKLKRRKEKTEEPEVPLDFPPVPGPEVETEPVTEPTTEAEPEVTAPESNRLVVAGRPS